jgi:hypothetical protein
MEAEGSYDGVPIEISEYNNEINIDPDRETYISFSCFIWNSESRSGVPSYEIIIPTILLSGKLYDVTLNNVFPAGEVWIDGTGHRPETISIEGWIKRDLSLTRLDPAFWPYDCDIDIECEVDGKPLELHITRMNYH